MWEYNYNDELYHYGIKGMRWGHRRARKEVTVSNVRGRYDTTKADYKQAKKAYSKAYNKAYNYTKLHPISQFVRKKQKAESDRRWGDAIDKADRMIEAKSAYKTAKRERREQIKTTYKEINKNSSFGEKLKYSEGTRKLAAKYVVDNDMSVADATKKANKAAMRNTAVILSAYGAMQVADLYIRNKR